LDCLSPAATRLDRPGLIWRFDVRWRDFAPEAMALGLIEEHWRIAGPYSAIAPLEMDHRRFLDLDRTGKLDVMVVRDAGRIVGYLWSITHFSAYTRAVKIGSIEAAWAAEDHRGPGLCGGLGWRMIKTAIARLKAKGVTVARFGEKATRPVGGHLKRLGFVPTEISYTLLLNPPKGS
jgi:hypothetical protein